MIEWRWWWSRDEERYQGNCATREEAIAQALQEAEPGDGFHILEATKGRLSAAIFDNIDERFDDHNEELDDPDGDPISTEISRAQWTDLDKRLTAAMQDWIAAHDLDQLVWSFGQTRNAETVITPAPSVSEERP